MEIEKPDNLIIELTAFKMAAELYEIGRSQGMTSKYKTARAYAKAQFENFIPRAVEILTDMLHNPSTSEHIKQEIYDAIMERTNNVQLDAALPTYAKRSEVARKAKITH